MGIFEISFKICLPTMRKKFFRRVISKLSSTRDLSLLQPHRGMIHGLLYPSKAERYLFRSMINNQCDKFHKSHTKMAVLIAILKHETVVRLKKTI